MRVIFTYDIRALECNLISFRNIYIGGYFHGLYISDMRLNSAGQTRAIKEFMPDAKMRTFPFGWMPNAYVVKP